MANVKAPKLTREGIKEMLEKASKQADMREKIRLRGCQQDFALKRCIRMTMMASALVNRWARRTIVHPAGISLRLEAAFLRLHSTYD